MSHHHDDDVITNFSTQDDFNAVLSKTLNNPLRRDLIKGGLGLSALAAFPMLQGCGGGGEAAAAPTAPAGGTPARLAFAAVPKNINDMVTLPPGYSFKVLHATGDRISESVPAYSNLGTEVDDWSLRVGDHHDGMDIFFIDSMGRYTEADTGRAVLAVNHESSADSHFFHPRGQTSGGVTGQKFSQFGGWDQKARPELEVLKEINHHGVSLVEVNKVSGNWVYSTNSTFNRRVNGQTVMNITGPAAHLADIRSFMVTAFDTTGATTRGTFNNCGHGKTPWGTYLACEENWAAYWTMPFGSNAVDAKAVTSRTRYGVAAAPLTSNTALTGSQGWSSVSTTDNRFTRFDISAKGSSAANDFRNEPNAFGYNVEIDPLRPNDRPAKRVAMGRFAHEAAVAGLPKAGQPLAFYMGCDSRREYIYKFVSTATWSTADVGTGLAAGNKYLNEGRLYVAKFNADGTGQWLLLDISVPAIRNFAGYTFANQADVLVNTRLAADAVGATPMDRPEWGAVNPANGEIYFCLTNGNAANRSINQVDAANPRATNANGHIIRFKELDDRSDALVFQWDLFVLGASDRASNSFNVSGLTSNNAFSSPDGLWFSKATGICWIQTDDGAINGEVANQLLAAIPGRVGDGGAKTITNTSGTTTKDQQTFIGQTLGEARLLRFLTGPKGCEVTGITESPDGKAVFVNIQHPGEDTPAIGTNANFTPQSLWPGNAGYGPAGRPRSATIVITKNDGGVIGS